MTDEERQKLVAALRSDTFTLAMNYQAADEIDRLAALAQSNAEPVAWPDIDAALRHAQPDAIYPGGRTKAEWDVIARASYERAKDLPDD